MAGKWVESVAVGEMLLRCALSIPLNPSQTLLNSLRPSQSLSKPLKAYASKQGWGETLTVGEGGDGEEG